MANIQIQFGSHNMGTSEDVEGIQFRSGQIIVPVYIPRKQGYVIPTAETGFGEVSLTGKLTAVNYTALQTALDTFVGAIKNGKNKLTFDDGRYAYGQLRDFDFSYTNMNVLLNWNAVFVSEEAKLFSATFNANTTSPTSGVGYTVTNAGNVVTRCKITITNNSGGSITNFVFQNSTTGDLFKYVGTLVTNGVLVVNNYADYADSLITVTNQGVSDIANFQGGPVTLASGANTIIYTGTTAVSVKVEWHDAWYM